MTLRQNRFFLPFDPLPYSESRVIPPQALALYLPQKKVSSTSLLRDDAPPPNFVPVLDPHTFSSLWVAPLLDESALALSPWRPSRGGRPRGRSLPLSVPFLIPKFAGLDWVKTRPGACPSIFMKLCSYLFLAFVVRRLYFLR